MYTSVRANVKLSKNVNTNVCNEQPRPKRVRYPRNSAAFPTSSVEFEFDGHHNGLWYFKRACWVSIARIMTGMYRTDQRESTARFIVKFRKRKINSIKRCVYLFVQHFTCDYYTCNFAVAFMQYGQSLSNKINIYINVSNGKRWSPRAVRRWQSLKNKTRRHSANVTIRPDTRCVL